MLQRLWFLIWKQRLFKVVFEFPFSSNPTAFLEFLYSDHVKLDEALALELLTQADKYSVPELKKICETYLSRHISPGNYMKIANLSELVEADSLKESVVKYIAKNIKRLKKRQDFNEISDHVMREVIIKLTTK